MPESRTHKSLKNAQVSLIYYIIQLVLSFWSRKVFFDYLGSEILGLDTTASNLLGMLNLAEMGVGTSVAFFLYKPLFDGDTNTINRIVALQGWIYRRVAIIIIAGGFVMMCFFPRIFVDADVPTWCPYATFGVMLYGSLLGYFINYKQIVLSADQKGYIVSRVTQGANIGFKIIVLIIMPYSPDPFLWYLGMNFWGSTFGCIWLCHVIKKEYPWLTVRGISGREVLQEMPDVMRKTYQVFIHNVSGMIFLQICPLLMYKFTSLTMIAYYGNYLIIIGKMSAILDMVFGSTSAAVGNLIASGDKMRIKRVFWELIDSRLCISWIALFSVYFLIQPFIRVWLGEKFILPDSILVLLIIQQAIHMNRSTVSSYLYGNGQFRDVWAPITEGIMTFILSYYCGKKFGIEGVLLGIIIPQCLIIGIWKPYFLFVKGFGYSWKDYFFPYTRRCILICMAASFFCFIFSLYDFNVIRGYFSWSCHAIIITLLIAIIMLLLFQTFTQGMKDFTCRMHNVVVKKMKSWKK